MTSCATGRESTSYADCLVRYLPIGCDRDPADVTGFAGELLDYAANVQTAEPLVPLRSVGISWAVTDLPLAAIGSVAAFALDDRGGVGVLLPATGFFFVIVLALWVVSIRGLGDGTGVRRVPPGAEVRTSDIGRRVLVRLPLRAALVAGLVLALGTYGAGMALGATLPTAIWLPLLARWEANRGLTVYRPVRTPWRRSKGSRAGYYVQPSSVGAGNR